MKKKIMILMTTAILAIGGITIAYAQEKDDANSNKLTAKVNYQTTSSYKNMINLMKQNGFDEAAKAMENKDFDAMNKFMSNITDEDYKKMIDIMKNNGYASMAKMMEYVSRQDMINMHKTMMGR